MISALFNRETLVDEVETLIQDLAHGVLMSATFHWLDGETLQKALVGGVALGIATNIICRLDIGAGPFISNNVSPNGP